MKVLKLLIVTVVLFFGNTLSAQVSVSINVGSPPLWGPVGYTEVQYYYLPDVEAYYDIQTEMFIYYGDGVWIRRAYLPSRYRYYDLYSGYKVVLTDYHGNEPYVNFKNHKVKYAKGYRDGNQKTIGEKPGRGNGGNKNYKNQNSSDNQYNEKSNQNNKNYGGGNKKDKGSNGNDNGGGKNNQKGGGHGGGHGKK